MKAILSGCVIWLLHVSFEITYLGIAICNLKSTHKDHPPRAAQTFNYSGPQIILNNPWLVLFVISFPFLSLSFQFPFLSFHCPFNFLSFPFIVLSISFPFLSFLFLSFNLLSFPFISNSNQNFLGFFWISHYLGPTLDQGGRGGGLLFRGGHYRMYRSPFLKW